MRKVHRYFALVAVFFGLYVGATGTLIQMVDLRSILGNASANDPEMQAIRDGRNGPPNFQVLRDADFGARTLPAGFDFDRALAQPPQRHSTAVHVRIRRGNVLGPAQKRIAEAKSLIFRQNARVTLSTIKQRPATENGRALRGTNENRIHGYFFVCIAIVSSTHFTRAG